MHISMTVRMDMDDVQEAVLALLRDKMTIAEDADVSAIFDAESDVFVISIGGEEISLNDNQEGDKKPRRRRRTKAEIEADKAAEEAQEQAKTVESSQEDPASAADQENGAPWEDKQAEPVAETAQEPSGDSDAPTEPAPVKAAASVTKIFPEPDTSTPPASEPAANPKSLFANLTKPVNQKAAQ